MRLKFQLTSCLEQSADSSVKKVRDQANTVIRVLESSHFIAEQVLNDKIARTMSRPDGIWTLSKASGTSDYLKKHMASTARNIGFSSRRAPANLVGAGLFYNEPDQIYSEIKTNVSNNGLFTLSLWVKFDKIDQLMETVIWVTMSRCAVDIFFLHKMFFIDQEMTDGFTNYIAYLLSGKLMLRVEFQVGPASVYSFSGKMTDCLFISCLDLNIMMLVFQMMKQVLKLMGGITWALSSTEWKANCYSP